MVSIHVRPHNPLDVMLLCVRWYVAYPLSLRNMEEMMAERGVEVDHATVHRCALTILPVLAAVFRRRKRPVGSSGRCAETYVKVGGQWNISTAPSTNSATLWTSCSRPSASDKAELPSLTPVSKTIAGVGKMPSTGGHNDPRSNMA